MRSLAAAVPSELEKLWASRSTSISPMTSVPRGIIQPFLKTQNGAREVDLCTELAELLRKYVGDRREGLLFHTSTGAQLLQANTLQDSLHPILKKLKHPKGGFNIFRRFRLTHVSKSECPEFLRHFWSGQAQRHVSERYIKMLQERAFRLEWAEKVGMGFKVPVGPLGLLLQMRKSA
jgi:hypothetical protein